MYRKNYYSVLKVKKNASLQEIESAYRRLSLRYDQPGENRYTKKTVIEKFKDIGIAYYILSDSKRRQEYDIYRNEGNSCGNKCKISLYESKVDFSFEDLINSINFNLPLKISEADCKNKIFDVKVKVILKDKCIDINPDKFIKYKKTFSHNTNIYLTINLNPELAIKGAVLNFILENKQDIRLEIPSKPKNGQRMILKGLGERCPVCDHKGDIIVTLYIDG